MGLKIVIVSKCTVIVLVWITASMMMMVLLLLTVDILQGCTCQDCGGSDNRAGNGDGIKDIPVASDGDGFTLTESARGLV